MHNIIALVLLLTAGLRVASNAQTGSVLETEGIGSFQQIVHLSSDNWPDYRLNLYYTFREDTVVNNKTYHKQYYRKFKDEVDMGTFYNGALRAADKRVYFLHRDSTKEFLFFDYNLQIGDTLPARLWEDHWGPLYVVGIDSTVLNDGIKRRYLSVSGYPPPWNGGPKIYEGLSFQSVLPIRFVEGNGRKFTDPRTQICKNGLGLFPNVSFYWLIPNNLVCDYFTDTEESGKRAAPFQVQPTLTSGLLSLSCDPALIGRPLQIAFYATDGRVLQTMHTTAAAQWEVDVQDLPSGMIFMKIQAEGTIFVKKIVKY